MGRINVKIDVLRLREKPSLSGKSLGYTSKGIHEYTEKLKADGYLWYHIENGWCAKVDGVEEIEDPWIAPEPVAEDLTKDQVKVSTDSLRVRQTPSFTGEIMGMCKEGYFDVLGIYGSFAHIGEDAYIAIENKDGSKIDGVRFIKGTADPDINVLRQEVAEIREMLELCMKSNIVRNVDVVTKEEYDDLPAKKASTLYLIKK